jgi:hypothetical protein
MPGRDGGDLLQARRNDRAQGHQRPRLPGSACRRPLTFGMREDVQAGGGDQDRHTDGRAEHRRAKVRAGHAPEHAREEAEPLEGGALLQ